MFTFRMLWYMGADGTSRSVIKAEELAVELPIAIGDKGSTLEENPFPDGLAHMSP